jgi:hypothetical protein
MAIIRQMIKNAGGVGDVIEVNPPKLDCFDVVLNGEADSTWVFMGWEVGMYIFIYMYMHLCFFIYLFLIHK